MKTFSRFLMVGAALTGSGLSFDAAWAASQCQETPIPVLEKRIKDYAERPSLSRILASDGMEIMTEQADYNSIAGLWSVPFYLLDDGKRVKRFFALVDCDGGVELSYDQWFEAD